MLVVLVLTERVPRLRGSVVASSYHPAMVRERLESVVHTTSSVVIAADEEEEDEGEEDGDDCVAGGHAGLEDISLASVL